MRGIVVTMLLLAAACGGGSAPRSDAPDSTAAVAPAMAPEKAPALPPLKAPTKASTAPASPHIGYDSAYGPTFTVDSTGKVTRIPKKKP